MKEKEQQNDAKKKFRSFTSSNFLSSLTQNEKIMHLILSSPGSIWGFKTYSASPQRFPKQYSINRTGFSGRWKQVIQFLITMPTIFMAKQWPSCEQVASKQKQKKWPTVKRNVQAPACDEYLFVNSALNGSEADQEKLLKILQKLQIHPHQWELNRLCGARNQTDIFPTKILLILHILTRLQNW